MTAIVTVLGGWRATAFLAMALSALAFAQFEHGRVQDARVALAQAEVSSTTCAAVNASSDNATTTLQARLTTCLGDQKATAEAQRTVEAARERLDAALAAKTRSERSARDDLYSTDPDCGVLARVRVCRAIADRLRADADQAGAAGADASR